MTYFFPLGLGSSKWRCFPLESLYAFFYNMHCSVVALVVVVSFYCFWAVTLRGIRLPSLHPCTLTAWKGTKLWITIVNLIRVLELVKFLGWAENCCSWDTHHRFAFWMHTHINLCTSLIAVVFWLLLFCYFPCTSISWLVCMYLGYAFKFFILFYIFMTCTNRTWKFRKWEHLVWQLCIAVLFLYLSTSLYKSIICLWYQ